MGIVRCPDTDMFSLTLRFSQAAFKAVLDPWLPLLKTRIEELLSSSKSFFRFVEDILGKTVNQRPRYKANKAGQQVILKKQEIKRNELRFPKSQKPFPLECIECHLSSFAEG